jgi:polysaccharide chain length determinant protein (PEP-CTERM system associated)
MHAVIAIARRYASAAWRHRWKGLALAWLICLAGWAAVYTMPPRWTSSARIYADADAILGSLLQQIAVDASPTARVEMLQRTLLSRPNLERVITRTDLDMRVEGAKEREGLVLDLGRRIRIAGQGRNLFSIEYTDSDPRVARQVVQTVLEIFMEAATTSDRQQMDNARAFVMRQLAGYESQLREAERRRAEFQSRYVDLLPNDAFGGGTRLQAGRQRLTQLVGELEDARLRRDLVRQQLELLPPSLSPAEAQAVTGGGGDSRLAQAERNLRELRTRYTDQHPDVLAARALIAEYRASGGGGGGRAAGSRAAQVANPAHEQMRGRLVDAEANVASLERQVRDQQAEVERLDAVARTIPDVIAQFTNLNRDYTVMRQQYEQLLQRREAVQVADAARTGADRVRLEIIDPPTEPKTQSGPGRSIFLIAVLAVGLGGGAAVCLLLAQFDSTFYRLEELRGLGLPMLGAISAPPEPRRLMPVVAFGIGVFALVAGCGALLAGVPAMVRSLVA